MTKDTDKVVKFWLMSSRDNFETASATLKAGRYNFAMFMCQQAVEALLKAVFIILKNERPEYIHKLPRLVELTGIKVPKSVDKKILKIDAHYIKARYKEDRFNEKIQQTQCGQLIERHGGCDPMVYKKTEIRNIVLNYVHNLQKKIPVKRVILFGSYAYGRPTKASDIDIAVISDKFKRMDDIRRIMLLSDYARRVKSSVDIDPIGFTEEELKKADYFDIAGEIAEKEIVVYEATEGKRMGLPIDL